MSLIVGWVKRCWVKRYCDKTSSEKQKKNE